MIEGIWDIIGFPVGYAQLPSASYLVMDGAEIQSFTNSSITISANTNSWSNNDVLYSPPHHYQDVVGTSIILQKLFKTSKYAINAADGVRVVSRGLSPMDYGLRLAGPLDGYGGFTTGIAMQGFAPSVAIDLSAIASSTAAIRLSEDDKILLDATSSAPYIRGLGGNGVELVGQSGQYSLFATDGLNSDFIVSHPASGTINFVDSTLDNWLTQVQGSYVRIGPSDGYATQALEITQYKVYTLRGRNSNVTHTTVSYSIKETDEVIMIEGISGSINITLPFASLSSTGDIYTVKDAQGLVSTYPVTINTPDSTNIDGSSTVSLNAAYQAITFIYNSAAGRWNII
jgi:hypothetical protein